MAEVNWKSEMVQNLVDMIGEVRGHLAKLDLGFLGISDLINSHKTATSAAEWDDLSMEVRQRCEKLLPHTRLHVGNALLQVNARVANTALLMHDEDSVPEG